MKRIVWLSLGLGLVLGGCASFPNPLTQAQVFQLENGYGVAQSAAVAYTALPRCRAPAVAPCARAEVVAKLATADKKARVALDALEKFSRNPENYPGLSYAQLLAAAQQAVATLQQIQQMG